MGFQDESYARHAAEFRPYAHDGPMGAHAATWLDEGTVDAWRHARMYAQLLPLLEQPASWLTVGDGRYGKDAGFLARHGQRVLATDISDVLLKEAHAAGLIPAFRQENAEKLSFGDEEFDYVLCKESYHHFPRPMVALYEMLRVARLGVALIEPNDPYIPRGMVSALAREGKNLVNWLLGKKHIRAEYEDSGNFVFRVSRREMEKVALGLDYPVVAFKGLNDAFLPGVEKERMGGGPLLRRLKLLIGARNLLCRLGLMEWQLMVVLIAKRELEPAQAEALRRAGFEVRKLPRNPYLAGKSD